MVQILEQGNNFVLKGVNFVLKGALYDPTMQSLVKKFIYG